MLRKFLFSLSLLSVSVAFAEPVKVMTSFSILGDITRQIGGDKVEVSEIVKPNQDMHIYRITPQDAKRLKNSQLILLNGKGFESNEFVKAAKAANVPLVLASDKIQSIQHDDDDEHHHEHEDKHAHHHGDDPHVWQDPVLMKQYTQNIADALIQIDPTNKDYYSGSLKKYQQKLDDLDALAKKSFAAIPVEKRKVLTSHDSFAYFGARYQIKFLAPQGVSEESEPSAKQMAEIIRTVKRENIRAVFVENISNPKLLNRLTREAGVSVTGKLYSDALPENGGYVDMMKHNIETLSGAMKE
ncbi:MAG: zinc ABC transporter substrate-binding protein [Neisseriaceae bacterium]|nr:zinc ABC transporter substrate-binding protein [Neisseriaceae bacterium]MBO7555770.1 zinc ABC transporter substrate-binding protein [Neisseriaceae bacterium]